MDTVRVILDREGQTLTVWFGDPLTEYASAMDEHGVLVMKDRDERVIGVEILNFVGAPTSATFVPSVSPQSARSQGQ